METLLMILNEIDDSIEYEKEEALITGRVLDSFAVITLVSELEAVSYTPLDVYKRQTRSMRCRPRRKRSSKA